MNTNDEPAGQPDAGNEIKVGNIVYSPDYGKGRVVELETVMGCDVAVVGFAGHDNVKSINLTRLMTSNPADELEALRARVTALETENNRRLIDLHDLALLNYLDADQRRKIWQKYQPDYKAWLAQTKGGTR